MPRFFVSLSDIDGDTVSIVGGDAFHIARALRMACGEEISVCDGTGMQYECRLETIRDDLVTAHVLSGKRCENETPVALHLFQAWPKGDKPEFIVQKAVELGVQSVVFFTSERCIRQPKPEKLSHQLQRLGRIAREAAGQCGRAILPTVSGSLSFTEMLEEIKKYDATLFCYEGEDAVSLKKVLGFLPKVKKLAVIVGSEGGFSPSEAKALRENGAFVVCLGRRILRCETAPLFALSTLLYHFELES